jgi:hypothetical protein
VQAANLLRGRPSSFKLKDVTEADINNFILNVCTDLPVESFLYRVATELTGGKRTYNNALIYLIIMFYKVGIVGIKPDAFNETQWAFREKTSISDAQVTNGSALNIHPMVWRALGVNNAPRV